MDAGASPLKAWLERDGALLRLRLSRPKANLVDAAMIAALGNALAQYRRHVMLRAVLVDAEGPHFSFGASVEEHLPACCAGMLQSLHAVLLQVLEFPVPVLVAVQGQCLGGGLELALACGRIFAHPNAQFGQPEIKLGVFAPAASALLPFRVNQPDAEDLLLTGRSIGALEAHRIGLVQQVEQDPTQAALAWFEQHLLGKSAAALACATVAARGPMQRQVRARLAELERLYLDWLMRTHDANEGLAAFLEKRQPAWTHQ
ncbi:cyclohexa-1,5-dienecarbonyl-CoA hydratase [Ramlibacter tataouinensis]|uniref:cyclohexa-1,5-dienecarbonyl-CoA hydratase n=1 Tax=Ramlibacter tataouinensis TaxID=94132 RepID=UPI0022F3CC2B|nr:cyclohexa-1,5-dienecarbonyl-CoA hydratase [Ramlibacter tataouinensis]WBY03198.1 cyclohexa-1,5-dienecarbonyl-CoA hydratase [Ramlibacter tataouinensis]